MFWTDVERQLGLFDEGEYRSSTCIRHLMRMAVDHWPDADPNFYRQFAFLTHEATQNFLGPMLVNRYGSIPQAKVPALAWLDELGSLETFARATRQGEESNGRSARLTPKAVPRWYKDYLQTERFREMRERAIEFWRGYMGSLTCTENAGHPFEAFHHRDYDRLGEADEFRYLVPKCHECHNVMRRMGPCLPANPPAGVKQWI